jgi:diguanylate cyclase (GGDEF)-like protein/PAS domain S-box-containing protein
MKLLSMNPIIRISLGLSLFIMTLLLGMEALGVLPDPQQAILDSRKKTCESLAIYASLAIQANDFTAIKTTIDLIRQRNPDILSVALRKQNGAVLAMTGDHAGYWQSTEGKSSTLQNVKVPLFMGKNEIPWGGFEISFAAMHPSAWHGIWARPIVKILTLSLPLVFVGFFLIMKKTLRHLDPSAVVPERVKHALDSLVEGVILMDHNERIVLANKAFEEKFGDGRISFLGRNASELNWRSPQTLRKVEELPWQQAIQDGTSKSSIPLCAKDSEGKKRIFTVSGAPIIDMDGKIRGALATFDDVTQIEEQNTKLREALEALEKSRKKVALQDHELQLLATQDPLTKCLNRTTFYERLEDEFNRAKQKRHELTCIIVDIDLFKSINDNHGHRKGDEVIQQVSEILRGNLGESDVICRYDVEGFSLLIPETGASDGFKTAELIRRAVSDEAICGLHITVSMGISALEFQAGLPSELLKQANQALEDARNSGRDKAVVYKRIEPVKTRTGVVDQDFITFLVSKLFLAIGAMGDILVEEGLKDLGYTTADFPAHRTAELVYLLSQEIKSEDMRLQFKQVMLEKIKEKGY